MKPWAFAPYLTLLCLISGCSTFMSKSAGDWGVPYSGTQCAVELVRDDDTIWKFPYAFVDVPLSLVTDTLLIPFDLHQSLESQRARCFPFFGPRKICGGKDDAVNDCDRGMP